MSSILRAMRALDASLACAGVILFATVLALVRWPIVALDVDLWYHLSAGRFLFEHHALPDHAWFSWLPDRRISDFYGVFQALVFLAFRAAGYPGLIAVRTALFAGTAALVFAFLLRGEARPAMRARAVLVGTVIVFTIMFRGRLLRPHLLSYLSLASLLYLLEFEAERRFAALATFAVGVVWVNAHGVMYPVMCAASGAFLAERLWDRRGKGALSLPERRGLLSAFAPFLSIFATPFGVHLLPVPFTSAKFASVYIAELAPVSWRIFDVSLLSLGAIVVALLFLIAARVATRAGALDLKIRHLLLLVIGVGLLGHGVRFLTELSLLSLPLLRTTPSLADAPTGRAVAPGWTLGGAVSLAVSVVLSAASLHAFFREIPAWPVSREHLPVGVAKLIARAGAGTRVLNTPAMGGMLEWELYDTSRILMDMDVPFVFSDEDYYAGTVWPDDPEVFRKIAAGEAPDFLVVPLGHAAIAGPARDAGYVPVFVDDTAVLYVLAARHAALATEWTLRTVDPFALGGYAPAHMTHEERVAMLAELEHLRTVDPGIALVNALASRLAHAEGDDARARALAAEIVASYPDLSEGYELRADALLASDVKGARDEYARALSHSSEEVDRPLLLHLRDCDRALGRHHLAYREALEAAGGFPLAADAGELYQLGVLAFEDGVPSEGRTWFHLALLRAPPDATELRAKITQVLGPGAAR